MPDEPNIARGLIREITLKSKDGNPLNYKNAIVTVDGEELPYVSNVKINTDLSHKELIIEVDHAPLDNDGKVQRDGFTVVMERLQNWESSV